MRLTSRPERPRTWADLAFDAIETASPMSSITLTPVVGNRLVGCGCFYVLGLGGGTIGGPARAYGLDVLEHLEREIESRPCAGRFQCHACGRRHAELAAVDGLSEAQLAVIVK